MFGSSQSVWNGGPVEPISSKSPRRIRFLISIALLSLCATSVNAQQVPASQASPRAVIWRDPGNISEKNLYYGVGDKDDLSSAPFTYMKEDKAGTSPKFDVKDVNGEKWKAKLGPEAQAEVVASRLLWAVGYAANVNYYVPEAKIPGAHEQQKRGKKFIRDDDSVFGIRLQRNPKHEKKAKGWAWEKNPFLGTREFNGLRVVMALLNNWDLKDDNNAIWTDSENSSQEIYGVTDLGASFGSSGKSFTDARSKNNLNSYRKHKLVANVTSDHVDFEFPTHPSFIYYLLCEIRFIKQEQRHYWVGRNIPREDVKWISSLLGQLSDEQIRDAFRAAAYTPAQVDAFTAAVESRIAELKQL
jgi:hypothetical protein